MTTIAVTRRFPTHLLSASVEERVQYFVHEAVVDHPDLSRHLDDLEAATCTPTARNLLLVIGPTGVGKSTLLKQLNTRKQRTISDAARMSGATASAYLQLKSPSKGRFDFQALRASVLHAINAPLVDKTRPIVLREADGLRIPSLLIERNVSSLTGRAIETRFVNEVARRKVDTLIFDEAGSLFNVGRTRTERERLDRLAQQAVSVKDMANESNLTIVLGGAYDFYEMSLAGGQNARRTEIFHIKPYSNSNEGLKGFATAVLGMLCHLPVCHTIDPVVASTELMLQSCGCVGTSAGILSQALREAAFTRRDLTLEMVRKHYYSASALKTMRRELQDGIRRVDEILSVDDLLEEPAKKGDVTSSPPAERAKRLGPGETKPAHRPN